MSKQKIDKVQARVLVGTVIGGVRVEANDLLTGHADVVEHHVKAGELDKTKAAVNYCVENKARAVDLAPAKKADQITDNDIIEAIKGLDQEDKALWTKSGVPQVAAIEKALDMSAGTLKAADRDAAWRMIQDDEA